jgi:arylsulfatase A-like enzyme
MLSLLVLALVQQVGEHAAGDREPSVALPDARTRPNVLLVVADDLGVDLVRAYGEGSAPPCTPTIDRLAADGLLFRNAWANPVCSPTRAALLTGRHGFRTGIGSPGGGGGLLGLEERILPEVLEGYASACLGKWHLGAGQLDHPNLSGFPHFAGILGGGIADYESWTKVVDGASFPTTTYATRDTADDAIACIQTLPEPWFLYVPFLAPHVPHHTPPSAYCAAPTCSDAWCGTLPPVPTEPQMAKAMTEVLDAELGRVLAVLDARAPNTYVFFLGDNGTAGAASEPPFDPDHAKGTPYEGGLHVPLIVRGPGIVRGECQGLVGVTDLFATVAQLAHANATAEDSVSLVPYFAHPERPSLRQMLYSEQFSPNNSTPPYDLHDRAIRDRRYKLIRRVDRSDEFYDLVRDRFELRNLLEAGLDRTEREAYDALVAELVALGVDG